MDVKLRMVHFCSCLIEVVFLAGTIISVLLDLIHEVTSFNDKVVVCESESGRFEVAVFITVRSCKGFMCIVVVGIVLMLGNRRLVF